MVSSFGFPDNLQYSRLSTAINDLKNESERARVELVTGRISDLTTSLAGEGGEAQLLRKSISDIETLRYTTNHALGRASVTQIELARASEQAASIGSELLDALGFSDQNRISIAGEEARRELDSAVSGFNRRYEGRSLFAGDETDSVALANVETILDDVRAIYSSASDAADFENRLDSYFNDPAGGFTTSIYLGGNGNAPRAEVSNGDLVSYSVKADEQPVRNLLRSLTAIVVAAESNASAERDQTLRTNAELLLSAGGGIALLSSRVGIAEAQLQNALEGFDTEEAALTRAYNDKTAIDPYEAATRLQQLESQLQASFTLTARISQLSLVNFIR